MAPLIKKIEKGFVLPERPANAPAEKIADQQITRLATLIVKEAISGKRAIAMLFKQAAVETIGARSCQRLYLARTSSQFGVGGRGGDPQLFDAIHADGRSYFRQ